MYTDKYSMCVCTDTCIRITWRTYVKESDFEIGKCGHYTQKTCKEERVTKALGGGEQNTSEELDKGSSPRPDCPVLWTEGRTGGAGKHHGWNDAAGTAVLRGSRRVV